MTSKPWKFLLPLSLLYLFLLFFRIDRQSLWTDEIMGLEVVERSWSGMMVFFRVLPEQHPLYYLLLRAWLVFGSSELALRSLSALFALVSLWAIFFLARELFDEVVARVTAVLLCLSPFYLYFGQEARMYTLLGLLTIVSTLLLVKWLSSSGRGYLVGYGVTALLGVYTHFFFLFLLAAHLGFLLLRDRALSPAVSRLVLTQALVGVGYLPWALLILQGNPESQPWKGTEHIIYGIPYTLLRFSLGFSEFVRSYQWKERAWELVWENAGLLALAVLCFGSLALVGFRTLLRRGEAGLLVICGVVIPAALALVGSAVVILVGERYLLVSFPFYLLLLAVGMVTLLRAGGRQRALGVALIVLYLLLVGSSLGRYYFDPRFGTEQWAEVAEHLRANSGPADLIVVNSELAMGLFRYYYAASPQQQLFRSDQLRPEHLQASNRLWLVLSYPPDADDYVAAMQNHYRVVSNQLYPRQTGIRLLLLVRSAPGEESGVSSPAAAGGQRNHGEPSPGELLSRR